jgi:hypothetical protein
MSTRLFVEKIHEEKREELAKLRELKELLDQLTNQEQILYTVSVTSNR